MADYTTSVLIEKVKRWGAIPNSQPMLNDDNIIDYLNEEIQHTVAPIILGAREEYFIRTDTTAIIDTKFEYQIPTRAIGGAIKQITVRGNNGNSEFEINRVTPKNATRYRDGYYIQGNKIVLIDPSQHPNSVLVITYPSRPNTLVPNIEAAKIASIDESLNQVIVISSPPTWNISVDTFDLVQDQPQFDWLSTDNSIMAAGIDTFQFSQFPNDVKVGDWLCKAGESPVAQVPLEAINLICQGSVVKIMEQLGDEKYITIGQQRFDRMLDEFRKIIEPRISDQPAKVVNENSFAHQDYPRYYKY